ncbi:heavy-metal-associated domain-containing protein [Neisseria animalis]|uniref:Heavy-metal-associated domain-containing protein n=1 Tax=Neisseria animalis TaxID=492 RepID=A0A5P3MNV4_NEIAN|nr:heavy metal-associated domain-containing protein [Neisseria animalis]QEY23233.1 heavy-metal-associated domain-containing protein [Neisseria animalis]ROW31807.1 heavy-metal-associated domain-containing protein [Neisseria animalis]VEE08451.1 mercuric transport family protein [Neisseria animalis]
MANITLNIGGMTCGGCVKSVTRILEGVEGVAKAEVSLEQNNAVVEYDEAQTNPAALIEAVEDGGFDASL